MRIFHWIAALTCMAFSVNSTWADDLAQIERKIVQEPGYVSKPKYCLLVFAPGTETRVWVALDGDILYVDRNGNGDLTEDGERVAAKKNDGASAADGNLWFDVGDVPAGQFTHKNLSVSVGKLEYLAERYEQIQEHLAVNPQARGYSVRVEVEMPSWKGKGIDGRILQVASVGDTNGLLTFSDKPEDAPIIHFGGPWQVTLFGPQRLTAGRSNDLVLGVGTPGLGTGTTAFISYEGIIPEKVYPTVEVTFSAIRKDDAPIKELYEIKERC